MSQKGALFFILLFICAMTLHKAGCTIVDIRPKETYVDHTPIDPTMNPIQKNYDTSEDHSFIKEIDGVKVLLTPKAEYKVSARVVSKRHYYVSWLSKVSPVDLALAWGDFSSHKYDDYISYSHTHRFYYYRYDGNFPGNSRDIGLHSANEHLIPANNHIRKALKSVKVDEIVEITGELVNIEWVDDVQGGQNIDSSLTREDTGAGACEIIYVTKLKIKEKVYE